MTTLEERATVHVSDDTDNIAMREKRTVGSAADDHDTDPLLTRYIYSNHLQSASLELDENAEVISYEEYHPYGTTAYQASNSTINAVAKRYRYTGKERDDESGLYYHGARYYVPWLGRWTASDPLESKYAGMSPYNYSFNNPVMFNDPSGMDPKDDTADTVSSRAQGTGTASGFMEYSDGSPVNFWATQNEVTITTKSIAKEKEESWFRNSGFAAMHPAAAGFVSGIGEFLHDTAAGIGEMAKHPGETLDNTTLSIGYLMAMGNSMPGFVRMLPGGAEFDDNLKGALNNSWNEFKDGDAYTKANYIGYGTAFIGSFFIGAGETRAAGSMGKFSEITNTERILMKLGESEQGQMVVDAVKAGHLPYGVDLGKSRLSEETMRAMSEQHKIEFAQVYFPGTGKNGGGGNYSLYSGTVNSVSFPIESFLINHTHPGGTAMPSIFDIKVIEDLEATMGQKSSVILPLGKPAVRFNRYSEYKKK